jgi:hypothetical protein
VHIQTSPTANLCHVGTPMIAVRAQANPGPQPAHLMRGCRPSHPQRTPSRPPIWSSHGPSTPPIRVQEPVIVAVEGSLGSSSSVSDRLPALRDRAPLRGAALCAPPLRCGAAEALRAAQPIVSPAARRRSTPEEQCHTAQMRPTTDIATYLLNIAPATSSASAAAIAGFTARSCQTALLLPKTTSTGSITANGLPTRRPSSADTRRLDSWRTRPMRQARWPPDRRCNPSRFAPWPRSPRFCGYRYSRSISEPD